MGGNSNFSSTLSVLCMSVCVGEKVFENTWSPVSTSYGCERGGVRVYLDLEQSGLLADGHRDVTSTSIIF